MKDKTKALWEKARMDPEFREMEKRFSRMEKLFERKVSAMSMEDQDILWGCLLSSEEIDQYLLDLALRNSKVF